MRILTNSRVMRTIPLLIVVCLVSFPAYAQYSGGTGEPNDPYQIATAQQLTSIGSDPKLLDKHYVLIADIDLDPNLPGGQVFDRAVIAPNSDDEEWFDAMPFIGVFDGNGHTISHLTIQGGGLLGLFGQTDSGAMICNLGLEAVDVNGTHDDVGGLVGYSRGSIAMSYSTGTVTGNEMVGGLVGYSRGSIAMSYSTSTVTGDGKCVGGLVGRNNGGLIKSSYSTGMVS